MGKTKTATNENPLFALLVIFTILFVGSAFLFESMDVLTGPLYAAKVTISSLFAVSLGFIMSAWWSTAARVDEKIKKDVKVNLCLIIIDTLKEILKKTRRGDFPLPYPDRNIN